MSERRTLYVTAFLRAVTTSLVGVLLGVYLARLDITGAAFGAIVSAGLVGAALAAVVATFAGDRIGRRRFLILLTLLSIGGTVVFASCSAPIALAAAAFAGDAEHAVVDGDFVTFDGELQPVLKALRRANVEIVAIHSHMEGETPKAIFLHYWGIGPVEQLARAVKAALDTQRR